MNPPEMVPGQGKFVFLTDNVFSRLILVDRHHAFLYLACRILIKTDVFLHDGLFTGWYFIHIRSQGFIAHLLVCYSPLARATIAITIRSLRPRLRSLSSSVGFLSLDFQRRPHDCKFLSHFRAVTPKAHLCQGPEYWARCTT